MSRKFHAFTPHNICYFCGLTEPDTVQKGFRRLIEMHHIIERNMNGANTDFNKVPCCSTCHSKIHLNLIKIDTWFNFGYTHKLHWWNTETHTEYYGPFK